MSDFVLKKLSHGLNLIYNFSDSEQVSSSPAALNKSTNLLAAVPLSAKPSTSNMTPVQSPIFMFEQKLNKIYGNHDALKILDEIVALKVEMSDTNLKKITNMFAQKIVGKPDIIKSSVDILVNLPHRSTPSFDPTKLKNPLMLSLSDQLFHALKNATPNETFFNHILKFATMLHLEQVIDDGVIVDMSKRFSEMSKQKEKFPPEALRRVQEALKRITEKSETKKTQPLIDWHSFTSTTIKSQQQSAETIRKT